MTENRQFTECFKILRSENKPKIMVIGDAILDEYIEGNNERINPEAPVPLINVTSRYYKLGGAGNVVENLHVLNADVSFIGVLGDYDEASAIIQRKIKEIAVYRKSWLLFEEEKITPRKIRIISNSQQLLRYDTETTFETKKDYFSKFIELLDESNCDAVVFSDYGKGSITEELAQKIICECNKRNIKTFVDPHVDNIYYYKNCGYLKVNLKQARTIAKHLMPRFVDYEINKFLEYFCVFIGEKIGIKNIIVTLSENGMYINDGKFIGHMRPDAKKVIDVTGAGDSVMSTFVYCLIKDLNFCESVSIANTAAGISTAYMGTYHVSMDELEATILSEDLNDKILNQEELVKILKDKEEVVFVNGCFDILHPGHIELMRFAKDKGKYLVVGLNSDASIKRIKGESRPIINQEDRAKVLSELECVDYICIFDDDTPKDLIKAINPWLHVKGSDHEGEKDIENTIFFKRVGGYSTTNIIQNKT